MTEVTLLGRDIEFGLFEVAGDPNLTFIFFIGLMLLAVLGSRFAYYAHRNMSATEIGSQTPIWQSLRYIGLLAALYGLVGVLEISSSLQFDEKNGLLLGATLLLAFALRQIHSTATGGSEIHPLERVVRGLFVGIVVVYVLAVFSLGQSAVTAALEGAGALAFVTYGIAYFHDQTSNARLQGTMLDSLLRHLLPVLTFTSFVSIVALAIPFGLDRIIVLHIQVVFIIMTATALMTATIKLRQNLAGL